jgi:hypothetical protein
MAWLTPLRRRWDRFVLASLRRASADPETLAQIAALLTERSQPNRDALAKVSRDIDVLALNVKAMGYQLAQDLAAALPPREGTSARRVPLGSRASTQADMESDWVAHWCAELKVPVIYHRKLWEFAYVLQTLYNTRMLRDGARGLGFGVGIEPLASYFAANGVRATISDLDADDQRTKDWWSGTAQHASKLLDAHHSDLVSRERFLELVDFRVVDMNAIPADLTGYDFCWSTCALEHLGSIEHGLAFIENSLATLRPGGVAIHTTELNINPLGATLDHASTVLFQQQHFEALAARLEAAGHRVAPLNFKTGKKPLDRFIDLPPWKDGTNAVLTGRLGTQQHLKLAIDGYVVTCFGITVIKNSDAAPASGEA